MQFNEYQRKTHETFIDLGHNKKLTLARLTLGLTGEAGEVAEKVKKLIRDNKNIDCNFLFDLSKELGDIFWYISEIANLCELDLDSIAYGNIQKLQDRKKRNKLKGNGDSR